MVITKIILAASDLRPRRWAHGTALRQYSAWPLAVVGTVVLLAVGAKVASAAGVCERQISANVVALDQPFFYNRLGAHNPAGMIYALRRDVVDSVTGQSEAQGATLAAGQVSLRPDRRPRPIVLRMNVGDCLTINFQNLLAPTPADDNQPHTRTASVHVIGMQVVGGISDDGSNVGANPSSLASPGQSRSYTLHAQREGGHLLYSGGAMTGGEGDGGSLAMGLFGTVNVEPRGAEWYRSQVTNADLQLAVTGTAATGHPIVDYDRVYPAGHPFAGLPIFRMLNTSNEIVHSDLNAIITGPNRGNHLAGTYPPNPVMAPNALVPQAPGLPLRPREEPFREFTVVFHDEIKAIQAFNDIFEDPVLSFTLHSVRDGFAINYGANAAGAEVLANRLGVGPMHSCNECKYEEFFLSAWTVGDPAQIVDVPADTVDVNNQLIVGPKATKVLFPDDPSNVHHSYIGDHVKFRNVHAGPKEHHIFHLHAHQWLASPDSDTSTYLDSQAVGPGSEYSYDIAFNGSGNRNQTPGDAIYHCHFYPHFAQGMWALWRNHDTFEAGTALAADGKPAPGSRALPDGEIAAGTPIPAVVPLPHLAMAPMPGAVHIAAGQIVIDDPTKNPGFPFFVPGRAGHRAPHPPLDTVDNGGLPRHVVTGGASTFPALNRLDFRKTNTLMNAELVPENGTAIEQVAMSFHAQRTHDTVTPTGTPAKFVTNGRPAVAGAPFADPCVNDQGQAVGNPRTYKAAHIQLDMKLNKVGWHVPQARILSLWGDVAAFKNGSKAPEPLFFRANTNDCITYHLTSLIEHEYAQDDFQVRTPTDITGQHIHLVKFDVTSSDGSGNGWNYEDASFTPGEVLERIAAINAAGGLVNPGGGAPQILAAVAHPYFGVLGAQTTVQRWFADPILNNLGQDRTLRTVYTHDHFGPSTHQQTGLFAALIIEPEGSSWRHPETGAVFGGRFDGGPTSWTADILTPNGAESFREFALAIADFAIAYEAGGGVDGQGHPIAQPSKAINPPGKRAIGLPLLLARPDVCPGGVAPPCPEAVSADDPGGFTVNYRNEPVAYRVMKPTDPANPTCTMNANGTSTCVQSPGEAGDLSFALRSDVTRQITALNSQPNFYPPLTGGMQPGDPFTPLMRTYIGDNVRVRMIVGAHEEGHIASIHGLKWLHQASDPRSGWRNAQMAGISEQFNFQAPILPQEGSAAPYMDHLYTTDTSSDGFWNGVWGIMRGYNTVQANLLALPSNPAPASGSFTGKITNATQFNGVCPKTAPVRSYTVFAVRASEVIPGGKVVYNSRTGAYSGNAGPLADPDGLLYVRDTDLNATLVNGVWQYSLKPNVPVEPLVLRANAGDCIQVTLRNALTDVIADQPGFNTMPMIIEGFNANQVKPSTTVGLHAQLVAMDVTKYNGINVGLNRVRAQTAAANRSYMYRWYAGELTLQPNGTLVATPVEFGGVNLIPADPIKHSAKGLVGALVIEPQGATWVEDANSRLSATITKQGGAETYREFVVVFQDDIQLRDANGVAICPVGGAGGAENGGQPGTCAGAEDPEDSANKAVNYRTEPMWFRVGYEPGLPFEDAREFDFTNALSNSITAGADPKVPVFTASAGQAVRFHVLQPGGHPRNHTFAVHGHIWEREGYVPGTVPSQTIGTNPTSEWYGAQAGHGPYNHFTMVLKNGAGGAFGRPGDYLIRDQASMQFDGGTWAILRVTP